MFETRVPSHATSGAWQSRCAVPSHGDEVCCAITPKRMIRKNKRTIGGKGDMLISRKFSLKSSVSSSCFVNKVGCDLYYHFPVNPTKMTDLPRFASNEARQINSRMSREDFHGGTVT
jgi:hypothetical protein